MFKYIFLFGLILFCFYLVIVGTSSAKDKEIKMICIKSHIVTDSQYSERYHNWNIYKTTICDSCIYDTVKFDIPYE